MYDWTLFKKIAIDELQVCCVVEESFIAIFKGQDFVVSGLTVLVIRGQRFVLILSIQHKRRRHVNRYHYDSNWRCVILLFLMV